MEGRGFCRELRAGQSLPPWVPKACLSTGSGKWQARVSGERPALCFRSLPRSQSEARPGPHPEAKKSWNSWAGSNLHGHLLQASP